MRLYHGTNAKHVDAILEGGLLPGDQVGRSNWDEYPARPGMVYLSDSLPWRFALLATSTDVIEHGPAIIEVKVSKEQLLPDEDYLGQLWANGENERLKEMTDQADVEAMRRLRLLWRESLRYIGTVAHDGPVRVKQIRRVVILRPLLSSYLLDLGLNTKFAPYVKTHLQAADRAREITRWLMGDVSELSGVFFRSGRFVYGADMPSQARRVIELSGGRVTMDRFV